MSLRNARPRPCRTPAPARVLALVAALLLAPAAWADDALNVLVMRAADLEAQGRCAEAVEVFRATDRQSPRLALIAGRCQVRSGDYVGATSTLGAAQDLPDASPEVDLQLGIARYHLGELDAARASLDRSRARGGSGALLELYSGLLQLQADEVREAALSLERARVEDRRAVEPVASYYSFLAWRTLEDEERAQAALERLREEDPNGPWIAEAERILAGPERQPLRWWANAEAGLEFDSNVTVQGGGVSQVFVQGDLVSDKQDGRGIWTLDGGAELFRTDSWSGGVLGSYTGTAHFDIDEFDAHAPTGALWVDHYLAERTTLRARYDFGYAWLNYDPYVMSNLLSATLFQGWEEWGRSEVSVQGGWYDFKYDRIPPPFPGGIVQDGTTISVEAMHYVEPGLGDLELRGGYRFLRYSADGAEFDFDSHRVLLGFDVTLPLEVGWNGFASFSYQPYQRFSVYDDGVPPPTDPQPFQNPAKHRDKLWEFGTELEKFVTENVSVLARYRYLDARSNVDVYDYDRHVVGGYIRIRFR